jgi:putative transposase
MRSRCCPVEYPARATGTLSKARGRHPLPDADLVAQIKVVIEEMSTYGYRRVHVILRRKASKQGRSWPNAKRVYRVLKQDHLLLQPHTGAGDERRHDGQVTVERSNSVEIKCGNERKCPRCICARPL